MHDYNTSKRSLKRVHITIIFILLVTTMTTASCGYDEWLKSHVTANEEILCRYKEGNDYYFVSKSGRKLKAGYRIDITGEKGRSKSFIIRWGFKNSNGDYIGLSKEPVIEKAEFISEGNNKYFDEVALYSVFHNVSEVVDVAVGIKKYDSASNVPSNEEFEDSELKEIILCEEVLLD
ncbi:MAG: hypothetical protein ABW201_13115 [Candidatus Thiodiazotropha sp.]